MRIISVYVPNTFHFEFENLYFFRLEKDTENRSEDLFIEKHILSERVIKTLIG